MKTYNKSRHNKRKYHTIFKLKMFLKNNDFFVDCFVVSNNSKLQAFVFVSSFMLIYG